MARRRRGRALSRRYGRARGHWPLSRMSLSDYETKTQEAFQYLNLDGPGNEDERMLVLNGWREGKKPISVALSAERARRAKGWMK